MKFNEKLKIIREEKQMSLSEFANLLGTTKQVLSRYERGENTPKINTVMKYAKILDVSIAYLLNDEINDRHYEEEKSSTIELAEDEKILLELFRSIPEEKKELALKMLRVALKSK